ncbi:MAG: gluconate 2-dehydrogenase subunit 3 family protein [Chitinophagaceae bacterium]|nr:gluconate 2-dehydrogenase subunit 3 family protein [Chitinophagaceae bacterium]
MDRRSFIIEGGRGLGAISLGIWIANGCKSREASGLNEMFSAETISLINEIGETIIPATDTPGAKAAKVGEYIAVIVQDCYAENEKKEFKDTLEHINEVSNASYGYSFMKCKEKERVQLISKIEEEYEGFKSFKNLIVSAYLSSEIGMTQFFNYSPVPGKYDGCTTVRPW